MTGGTEEAGFEQDGPDLGLFPELPTEPAAPQRWTCTREQLTDALTRLEASVAVSGAAAGMVNADSMAEVILGQLTPVTEPPPSGGTGPGGYFAEIAFFGRVEHTGYVTEVTLHGGQAAYHIDLPEKLWGGNPLAWHEHAASAFFGKNPVTEESVRKAWEGERARAERWKRQQEEWERARSQPALPAGVTDGCGCGPDEECDECSPEAVPF